MTTMSSSLHIDNVLIILRGFPGAGKSSLTKAIKSFYGESKCISCSFDKYHWTEQEEGKGVFKFNYSIHKDTKKWCRQEILSSINSRKEVIIVDNGNFEKWEYSDFIKYAKNYGYRVLIIQIKSETLSISRYDHIDHMNGNKENPQCLLCKMQYHRCKMLVPNNVMKIFINKWQNDSNEILIEPKLAQNENWSNNELQKLLSIKKEINYNEYKDNDWKPKKSNKYKQNRYNKRNYHSMNQYDTDSYYKQKQKQKRIYNHNYDINNKRYQSNNNNNNNNRYRFNNHYNQKHKRKNYRNPYLDMDTTEVMNEINEFKKQQQDKKQDK